MAYAKESYISKKKDSKGYSSYFFYISKRWASNKEDKSIGIVIYDLTNKEDNVAYESNRKIINYK